MKAIDREQAAYSHKDEAAHRAGMNPERTRQWAALPAGSWRYLCDGTHAAAEPFGPACRNAIELAPVSVTILKVE